MLCFSSSLLIQWAASKFRDATFVTYEQIYPDDGFGIVMQKHFESMNSPLLSLAKFPDLESQEHRYVSRVCVLFLVFSVQHKKKSWSKLKISVRCIVNTPLYVRNSDLHCDLGIEAVTDIIATFAN
jgi:hypothetical protein